MTTFERRREIAQRIAARTKVIPPVRFSLNAAGYWERDLVLALAEGRVGGRMFATYVPITQAAYADAEERERVTKFLSESVFPSSLVGYLAPSVARPAGRLPQ